MCGRTACTLCKENLLGASRVYSSNYEAPQWVQKYSWQQYKPSYNISPKMVTPVLLPQKALSSSRDQDWDNEQLCLFPMKWGLIPHWYRGSEKDFSMSTHNCRYESALEKPTFAHALKSAQRCVVLADGFFEWKNTSAGKKPYFIYLNNKEGIDMKSRTWGDECFITSSGKWIGPQILAMAGIFDIWKSAELGVIYSYSIFTMNASKTLLTLHSRMPVILDNSDKVNRWLNPPINESLEEALCQFTPFEQLSMYEVDPVVNNIRNNEVNCVRPLEQKEKSISQPKITSWFTQKRSDAPK